MIFPQNLGAGSFTPPTPEHMLVRGWSVIPVRMDKRPAIGSWKAYQRTRPSVAEVREWGRKLRPTSWAVITGAISGLIALDFDGDTGNLTLRKLGLVPHVRTGSGGHHVYIEHPGFKVPTLNAKTKEELARLYPGMDIRGDGGYAIFCGVNQSGEYQWLRQPNPDPFESLPTELQESLKHSSEQSTVKTAKQAIPSSHGRVSAEHLIAQALERVTIQGRNNAGFWLACQLRDNGYNDHEAEKALLDYVARVPEVNSKGQLEPYSKEEAFATLHQAYMCPAREPWSNAMGRDTPRQVNPPKTPESQESEADLLSQYHNDHGNAERLITLHGGDIRYYYAIRRWIVWDGKRWRIDETGQAYKLAKEVMLCFLRQAIEDGEEKAEKFARQSLDHKRVSAMLASAECELPIRVSDLDRDGYLLNCANGTLELRTGQLRGHQREDYVTKLVHLDYKPEAKCPLFLQFLRRVMVDGRDASNSDGERATRLVAYLQKAFGYSLTGDVSEKVVFCLFGSGNNGKTTLLETIRFVLWEYSAQLQIDTLMSHRQRESNASLSDLADLRGARFVTTSEAEQGGRLAEGKLKYLSAGMGEVKTCRKYENPITFQAEHKLFIDANHKPIVRGTDQAIWNRLKLIPFDVTIAPDEIDKGLLEKLKGEAEGVLAWMVEGCHRWIEEGLGDPPEVMEASAGWRSEMSLLRDFIEDCCDLRPDAFVSVKDLRKAYAAWSLENELKNPTWHGVFDDELISKGCTRDKPRICGKQVRGWKGIQLKSEDDIDPNGVVTK